MKSIDYIIVSAKSLEELERMVQKFQSDAIAVEWYPSGSPFFQGEVSEPWHQALYGVAAIDRSTI